MTIEDAAEHGSAEDLRLACLWRIAVTMDADTTPLSALVSLSRVAVRLLDELGDLPAARSRAIAKTHRGKNEVRTVGAKSKGRRRGWAKGTSPTLSSAEENR